MYRKAYLSASYVLINYKTECVNCNYLFETHKHYIYIGV